MKHCMVAITLFCSVSGSRALKAGDNHDSTDGFSEALLRQLKVMPQAKCRCPDGYILRDGTCNQSIEVEAEEVCHRGKLVEGLCITPAQEVLQCPEEHITVCKHKDRAESPCCAKGVTADKVARCREGTEVQDGRCMRILAHKPLVECPPGYGLSLHGTQCVKEERGEASPVCIPPDVLSPEGDSCITTVEEGLQYVCPEGYECVTHSRHALKKHHHSPICAACARTTEAQPICGCPEGQHEVDGSCYDEEAYEYCQSRSGLPRKQAPPTKRPIPTVPTKDKSEEVFSCEPLGRVLCTCDHPFTLQCTGHLCTCINREMTPVVPVCNGETDENGNCISQARRRLLYECAEGFTCEATHKHHKRKDHKKKHHKHHQHHTRCTCVRVQTAEPTTRCIVGEMQHDKCIEVIQEPPSVECPPGYTESCCEDKCSCTKTSLAMREVKCVSGAVNIQGQCVYVSKPSPGCEEGLLREGKCVQDFMAPPLCG